MSCPVTAHPESPPDRWSALDCHLPRRAMESLPYHPSFTRARPETLHGQFCQFNNLLHRKQRDDYARAASQTMAAQHFIHARANGERMNFHQRNFCLLAAVALSMLYCRSAFGQAPADLTVKPGPVSGHLPTQIPDAPAPAPYSGPGPVSQYPTGSTGGDWRVGI